MKIQKRFPNVHFFVPLGNKKWFLDSGIHNATELDWWESRDLALTIMEEGKKDVAATEGAAKPSDPESITATIGALPCQHISARTPFDKAHTLWASWMVESGGKKIYFGG